jgi:hypothetical protein
MQLLKTGGTAVDNPSVFGDYGFFVPYKLAHQYTNEADKSKGFYEVRIVVLVANTLDADSLLQVGVVILYWLTVHDNFGYRIRVPVILKLGQF